MSRVLILDGCAQIRVKPSSHFTAKVDICYTFWLFNVAMENQQSPFLIGKSFKNIDKWAIFHGYIC